MKIYPKVKSYRSYLRYKNGYFLLNKNDGSYYKLDKNKNAVRCSMIELALQFEEMSKNKNKHVADEIVNGKRISTIWLGLNHQFINDDKPHIFETIVFDSDEGWGEIYCDRYSTWQEAEEGHKKAVEWVKNGAMENELS